MDGIDAKDAMKELTLVLMYLSRFTDGESGAGPEDYYAWKGYNFKVLNELADEDYIRQGPHPSRNKLAYITDTGTSLAKELLKKYNIKDWDNSATK